MLSVHEVKLLSEHADEEKHFQCKTSDLTDSGCCIFLICACGPPLRFCFLTPIEYKHFRDPFCLSKSQKTHKGSTTTEQVVIILLKETIGEAAEECWCWQRTSASSEESACVAWDEAKNAESWSGTLTASRLSEWRRTIVGQSSLRELVWGRFTIGFWRVFWLESA